MPSQTAKVVRAQTAIDIDADGVIIVGNSAAVAPHGRTVQEVVDRVQKRAGWIVKQRGYFDQVHPLLPPRRFVAGETRLYLGRQYRLKLIEDAATCVKFNGRFLWVHFRATLGGQLDWQEGGSGAFHTTSRHNPLVSGVS